MSVRIVVSIDIEETDDPAEAYAKVHSLLSRDVCWESTDEWYGDDGTRLSESRINEVCSNYRELSERQAVIRMKRAKLKKALNVKRKNNG